MDYFNHNAKSAGMIQSDALNFTHDPVLAARIQAGIDDSHREHFARELVRAEANAGGIIVEERAMPVRPLHIVAMVDMSRDPWKGA